LEGFDELSVVYKHLETAVLSNRLINPDPFEFKGLRDYQYTDPLKHVNFKASAITQKLMVNVHAPTAAQRMVLVLNLESCGPFTDPEIYEQSIRLTATLAERYISRGVSVGFTTNGRDSVTSAEINLAGGSSVGHLYRIFECLARVSASYKCSDMGEYLTRLTDREQVYVVVSPYHGSDLTEPFKDLKERGVSGFLIIPAFKKAEIFAKESHNIFVWNV
jgi:uncharacterized protein (DUF58 family)